MAFHSPLSTENERMRDVPVSNHGVLQWCGTRSVTYDLMSRNRALRCKDFSEQCTRKIHLKGRVLQSGLSALLRWTVWRTEDAARDVPV